MTKLIKTGMIVLLCVVSVNLLAQNKFSIDLGVIRQTRHKVNGLNVSAFYHFNEKLAGGLEMNRFFPVVKSEEGEKRELSAWDFDLNFHYILPLAGHLKWFPLSGISHTSETENIKSDNAEGSIKEKFWSFNTGAGVIWETGHLMPHAEYSFTWGHTNQQFLLVGLSYEMEWGHHKKHHVITE
ncbi:MAG TPA: hypothetical protein PKA77_10715 [Chitinophagaceae bacterium]|nr:hypothetical protein [Chitinophagaceae bacterium]HMU59486.1 hypothetical protein [Chitinophagaceae bacterium]